jgi:hypothetical protein
MAENNVRPRLTFWGERVETVPQGFKQRQKQMLEAAEAAIKAGQEAVAAEPEPAKEPTKRKYTRHTTEE